MPQQFVIETALSGVGLTAPLKRFLRLPEFRACLALSLGAFHTFGLAMPADVPAPRVEEQQPAHPEQLLDSIARLLKPDWTGQFRQVPPSPPESRAQIAFAIGSVLAEGHLAAHAEDSQHSRNVGKDLLLLAKPIGAHAEMIEHSRSLSDYAEKHHWGLLSQELESVAADLIKALSKNGDTQLASLIQLGKWVRVLEIAASILHLNYSESAAQILQQPVWKMGFSSAHLSALTTIDQDPAISPVQTRLHQIQELLKEHSTLTPTEIQIRTLSETAHAALLDILSKHN